MINNTNPRFTLRQIIIKLRRHSPHFRQILPGNKRKIMMLVMVPNIKRKPIQRSVVTVRLVPFHEHVMLRNEMPGEGVQPRTQTQACQQVQETGETEIPPHEQIEADARHRIHGLPLARFTGFDEHRAERVEQNLTEHEDELPETGAKEPSLRGGGYVGIDSILALIPVMLHVVNLERHAERNGQRKIHDHSKDAVMRHLLETEIVR
mmetsp:Transcript_25709/g.37924  ORF Transcript_25709/g.37924 Transcript_25709/m.37924 type:complete len:207 (+) Transcript_25709:333-953(+)